MMLVCYKKDVSANCSPALGVPFTNRGQTAWKIRTRTWCWYVKKGCSGNLLTGFRCAFLKHEPDSLGKSGPGHGVGMPKKGVATIYSLALSVPCSNRNQTVWESQDQFMVLVCKKKGVATIYSLALGLPFSNRRQTVWENQDQFVILELF
jgi:hypothetical protein